ncbi:MAG: hypothetical protein U0992_06655 [Planctomycetaceae bacterium]
MLVASGEAADSGSSTRTEPAIDAGWPKCSSRQGTVASTGMSHITTGRSHWHGTGDVHAAGRPLRQDAVRGSRIDDNHRFGWDYHLHRATTSI